MNQKLKDLIRRAETWPEEAQEELARLGLEVEAVHSGAPYPASPEELAALEEADASGVATEAEVAAAFVKFRRE